MPFFGGGGNFHLARSLIFFFFAQPPFSPMSMSHTHFCMCVCVCGREEGCEVRSLSAVWSRHDFVIGSTTAFEEEKKK